MENKGKRHVDCLRFHLISAFNRLFDLCLPPSLALPLHRSLVLMPVAPLINTTSHIIYIFGYLHRSTRNNNIVCRRQLHAYREHYQNLHIYEMEMATILLHQLSNALPSVILHLARAPLRFTPSNSESKSKLLLIQFIFLSNLHV